jgi:alpha-tubulin suppressor-like RCC1 family protein
MTWLPARRLAVVTSLAASVATVLALAQAGPASAGLAATRAAATGAGLAGTVQAWGENINGELGNGTTSHSSGPVAVQLPAGVTVTAVASGGKHSLAITSAGKLLAWGDNFYGQLGDGTRRDSHTPVLVRLPKGTTVTAIAAGGSHSLAVTASGGVLAWGDNFYGQLGDASTATSQTPVRVRLPKGTHVVSVAASYNSSMALTAAGHVLTWGYNGSGQLGNGFHTASEIPVRVALPKGVRITTLVTGGYDGLALSSAGKLYAWGDGKYGQLGDGVIGSTDRPVLVRLPRATRIVAIGGGSQHSLALTSAGKVLAWGLGMFGELGNGMTVDSDVPVQVHIPAGDKIVKVSAGGGFSLALTSTGQVLAWGHNEFGQLGNGRTNSTDRPVLVRLPAGLVVTALPAGPTTRHVLVIGHG